MAAHTHTHTHASHPACVPSHSLKQQVVADKDDSSAKTAAAMLYETALLESGFDPDDPKVTTAAQNRRGEGEVVG